MILHATVFLPKNWAPIKFISFELIQSESSLPDGQISYSYTIPTRAVWDLLPEPEGEGNKFHAARGGCGITILKPTIVTHALPSDSLTSLIIAMVTMSAP